MTSWRACLEICYLRGRAGDGYKAYSALEYGDQCTSTVQAATMVTAHGHADARQLTGTGTRSFSPRRPWAWHDNAGFAGTNANAHLASHRWRCQRGRSGALSTDATARPLSLSRATTVLEGPRDSLRRFVLSVRFVACRASPAKAVWRCCCRCRAYCAGLWLRPVPRARRPAGDSRCQPSCSVLAVIPHFLA